MRLQRDENAPMLPSSTVVPRCARTQSLASNADVPLPLGATGHVDQARSRQAPEWGPMGVLPANALVRGVGSELRTHAMSASTALLEEFYGAPA